MEIMMNMNMNINNDIIIDITKPCLMIKEFLNILNYNYNEEYFLKFWKYIKNNKTWIYIDNDILNWIGYTSKELKENKRNYINLLKENFNENNDFKHLNIKEFLEYSLVVLSPLENIEINTHNKTKYVIITPTCFKQSLMMMRTKKANETKKYYIELEKIFIMYIQYQNNYQKKQLTEKDKYNKIKTSSFINSFIGKPIIYLIKYLDLIKFGYSLSVKPRMETHQSFFYNCEILYIKECYNPCIIENNIRQYAKDNDILITENIKDKNITELIQPTEKFTIEKIIKKIEDFCKKQDENINKENLKLKEDNDKINNLTLQLNNIILEKDNTINDLTTQLENTKIIESMQIMHELNLKLQEDINILSLKSKPELEIKTNINFETKQKKKFKCEKCEFTCNSISDLKHHLNRKFPCDQSRKTITKNICNKCGLDCKKPSKLLAHQNRKNPCDNILQCNKCNYIFKNLYNYNNHMKRQKSCI
jgi:MSV199 domain-containing protein/C2H2 type zinc finger protein